MLSSLLVLSSLLPVLSLFSFYEKDFPFRQIQTYSHIFRHIRAYLGIIQAFSESCVTLACSEPWYITTGGIFRALEFQNAGILKTRGIFRTLGNIQNQGYILNLGIFGTRGIFRTLSYIYTIQRFAKIVNPLCANFTKWSDTLKQFVVCCRRIA